MKKVFLFAAALFGFAAFAGPKADADLARIRQHITNPIPGDHWTWVFYGDSVTHGCSHTGGWRNFVEIFEERLRWELHRTLDTVINSGNSGHSSVNLLNDKQYRLQVRRFAPTVVPILVGSNDIVRPNAGTIEDFRSRLEKLVRRVREEDHAIPILQTYNTIKLVENPTTEYLQGYVKRYYEFPNYNRVIRETAEKLDVILIDHSRHWETEAADPDVLDFWLGETIHPGARGHLEMAKVIFKALGMYDPDSRCCRVEAGGKMPVKKSAPAAPGWNDGDFAVKSWMIDYSAGNGLPPADLWKIGYPADRLSIVERDGKKALLADSTGLKSALVSYARSGEFGKLAGTVVIELELAFPEPPPAGVQKQFYFGFSAGGDRRIEAIFGLGAKGGDGTFESLAFPPIPWGKYFTVKAALDMATGSRALWVDGKKFDKYKAAPLSGNKNFLYFGDGGGGIEGKFELRSFRMGVADK